MYYSGRAETRMVTPVDAELRKEPSAWTSAYTHPSQVRRRRATITKKLDLLGISRANRGSAVLDLCCGNGETLETLYALGFRSLQGLDIEVPGALQADTRFRTLLGDAAAIPLATSSVDWVLLIDSLHHLGPLSHIDAVLSECHRVLKAGGRLGIVDFPSSPQVRLAFWFFRQRIGLWTPYLKSFGAMVEEEWCFLSGYLADWPAVDRRLRNGLFETESIKRGLIHFFWTLRKATGAKDLRVPR